MMESSDFLQLLRALTHLSSTQLERAQQHIQHHLHADLLRQSMSEYHGDEPICCPHCHSVHVVHWDNLTAHFVTAVRNVIELSIS